MISSSILITGGTGFLGRATAAVLQQRGISYAIAGRSNPDGLSNWKYLDLEQDFNVDNLVAGHSIILHLASGTRVRSRKTDVEGTRRLVNAAKQQGVKHFIYISIVGIDKVPMEYYQSKLMAEREIIASGIPYTILRTTQFHGFVDFMLNQFLKYPVAVLPMIQVQPIDITVVAAHLCQYAEEQPRNTTISLGGKEIFGSRSLAEIWLCQRRQQKLIITFPGWGNIGRALRSGALTCEEQTHEGLSWSEWVAQRYPAD